MSDFQKYLDQALKNVDLQPIEPETTTYEYNIFAEISEQIIKARNDVGITQKELAQKSGLTQANISKIENGTSHPTIDSLKKIADGLGKRLSFRLIEQEDLNNYD